LPRIGSEAPELTKGVTVVFRPRDHMPQTSKLNFERAAREFAQWLAVPEKERSPAPAW
jgi:hypothetical protein